MLKTDYISVSQYIFHIMHVQVFLFFFCLHLPYLVCRVCAYYYHIYNTKNCVVVNIECLKLSYCFNSAGKADKKAAQVKIQQQEHKRQVSICFVDLIEGLRLLFFFITH